MLLVAELARLRPVASGGLAAGVGGGRCAHVRCLLGVEGTVCGAPREGPCELLSCAFVGSRREQPMFWRAGP